MTDLSVRPRAVALYLLILTAGSWLPAVSSDSGKNSWGENSGGENWGEGRLLIDTWSLTNPVDVLLNLLLYVPLGAMIGSRLCDHSRRCVWLTTGMGFCISLVLELGQLAVPGRVTALSDLLLNTAGALTGALLYLAWSNQRRSLPAV